MKKHILILAVLVSCCLSAPVNAQVHLSVNIGVQPIWGPVGYDHVDYYYLPDIEAYYSVPLAQYTWFDHGRWVTTPGLPPRYANFDLFHAYKVVLNEPNPWMHHDIYRAKYAEFRGRHDQALIRESHDPRYFENPHHPEHAKFHGHPEQHHEEHHEERHDDHR